MILTHKVSSEDDSKQVKYILKSKLNIASRLIKRLKFDGRILCNKIPVRVNEKVKSGDIIQAMLDFDETNEDIISEDIPIDIIYEDDCLIALNKPSGIVVHPTSTHPSGTVANGVMRYFREQGITALIRPVSRLDRDTSGIIVFAKNQHIQELLIKQMKSNSYYKEYVGIVHGNIENTEGVIDLPIDRKPDSIMVRHIADSGAASVTHYVVIDRLKNATYLKFVLETGRTHQIRVHCQAIGHPILGDTLYPHLDKKSSEITEKKPIERQALHSYKTIFKHPLEEKVMELVAPVPKDILTALKILKL